MKNRVGRRAVSFGFQKPSNPFKLVGAVAKWSKALLLREKINESLKIPGLPPCLGNLYKIPLSKL